jgi:hypothetical protein
MLATKEKGYVMKVLVETDSSRSPLHEGNCTIRSPDQFSSPSNSQTLVAAHDTARST